MTEPLSPVARGAFVIPVPANPNYRRAEVIQNNTLVGAEIILHWRGSAAVFDLEFTDSLVGGVWQRVPAMMTSRGDEHSVTVTSSTAAR